MINLKQESVMLSIGFDIALIILGIFIENRRPWAWDKITAAWAKLTTKS